jgi:hypothetical protein
MKESQALTHTLERFLRKAMDDRQTEAAYMYK